MINQSVSRLLLHFCINYYQSFDGHYHLNSDTTPINKAHSPVLSERSYIHMSNNVIKTNKPLGIGIEPFFRFSKQNLFLESFQTPEDQHLKTGF